MMQCTGRTPSRSLFLDVYLSAVLYSDKTSSLRPSKSVKLVTQRSVVADKAAVTNNKCHLQWRL